MTNKMTLSTPIGRLRIAAILEGISFLLFAITMPLKYIWDIPEPNFFVGTAHGGLFIIYIVLALQNTLLYGWSWKTGLLALVASVIPGGTFYADHKVFKHQAPEY